jgi:RNase P/RNase MRP subunit p29
MQHDKYLTSESNILKIRLIGEHCKVKYIDKIFTGIIKNESKNTWQIMTTNGLKIIPKKNSILQIEFNEQIYEINGNRMKGRHEDRIKQRMKRKW